MKVAVEDANVLIDLLETDLLQKWFELGIPTHTTDLVLNELERSDQRIRISTYLDSNKLQTHTVSADDLGKVVSTAQFHQISIADASALQLAEEMNAVLLTGDRRLRKISSMVSVEVRGVLWIFDQLIERRLLHPSEAAQKLRHLLDVGSFLPVETCERRISEWEKKHI